MTPLLLANMFDFSFLPRYASYFIRGVEYTLILSAAAVLLAIIPALLLALMRLSKVRVLRWISGAYIAVFRSTPMLVQLSIVYFGVFYAIKLPSYMLFGFINVQMFIPGVVALALNSAAYVAEIFRAGILAVDQGQTEAARSLGLSQSQTMLKIVMPQAIKNILPALCNEFIMVIKETALASTFFVGDLMTQYKVISGALYLSIEPLIIVGAIYLIITFTLSKFVAVFERRMKASD